MFEVIIAGGWMMLPILLCSVAVITIAIERYLALRTDKVLPPKLLGQVWHALKHDQFDRDKVLELKQSSPMGFILAAGLANASTGRDQMKDSIEEAANQVIYHLEKYVSTLGTISTAAPLMGLLGTVSGMIEMFTAVMMQGAGNPTVLAGGISTALITTAGGLCVAIPAILLQHYFERRIDSLTISMEDQALRLIDALHGERAFQVMES